MNELNTCLGEYGAGGIRIKMKVDEIKFLKYPSLSETSYQRNIDSVVKHGQQCVPLISPEGIVISKEGLVRIARHLGWKTLVVDVPFGHPAITAKDIQEAQKEALEVKKDISARLDLIKLLQSVTPNLKNQSEAEELYTNAEAAISEQQDMLNNCKLWQDNLQAYLEKM